LFLVWEIAIQQEIRDLFVLGLSSELLDPVAAVLELAVLD